MAKNLTGSERHLSILDCKQQFLISRSLSPSPFSASLFLCLSFLSVSLSPFSVKQSFNGLLFFLFHRQGKYFLLAVCVNKWKEWMIVCFGFQFLERAVFDLSISLSSVLCLSISLSLFSLGLSFSFFLSVQQSFLFLSSAINFLLYQEGSNEQVGV